MTFYIAGRFTQGQTTVKEVRDAVISLGHTITFDWTQESSLQPYHHHRDVSIQAALKMKAGAIAADIFILIWDDSLYGALVELGMALAASDPTNPKKIFIVGHKERVGIFEMLPEFKVVENVDQLLQTLAK